jgi:hypothetical protein
MTPIVIGVDVKLRNGVDEKFRVATGYLIDDVEGQIAVLTGGTVKKRRRDATAILLMIGDLFCGGELLVIEMGGLKMGLCSFGGWRGSYISSGQEEGGGVGGSGLEPDVISQVWLGPPPEARHRL